MGILTDKDFELVDVTMRDGALGRKFPYTLHQVKKYLHLLETLGIKYAEIGFINGPGKWTEGQVDSPNYNISPELNSLLHKETSLRLWSMIDSDNQRLKSEQVHANSESLVRLTTDIDKTDLLQEKINICKQKGIPFSINLKHTGSHGLEQIQSLAEFAQNQGAKIFYIVDTSGTMIPSQLMQIIRRLKSRLSIDLGFHGHDSLGFAAANSLVAIEEGCKYIDVSLCGIGAGGGNAITETFLLLAKGEACDWNKLVEAGQLLGIPSEYRELQERIFWGFIGCNTTIKKTLMSNPKSIIARKAMEWKYGKVLAKGEYTTLRLLDKTTPIVTKTAIGEGVNKLAKEIDFLELNESKLLYKFLPEVISYEVERDHAYYTMPYLPGSLLRDYIYSRSDFKSCERVLEDAIACLNLLHHQPGKIKGARFFRTFYLDRLRKRWEKLEDAPSNNKLQVSYSTQNISSSDVQSIFSLLAQGTPLLIDDTIIDFSLPHLLESLPLSGGSFKVPQKSIRLIHGDPHAGNILIHNNKTILLDPNGFLDGGDIAYDFGKLLVSFDWHDLSILNMLEPAMLEITPQGIRVTNNKIYKDKLIEKRHKALRRRIMSLLDEKVMPLHLEHDPMLLQRIKLLLYIHQFSFAPTLIKERPQTALHILLNAISDYQMLTQENKFNFYR